ncbi:hypothetical protein CAPTEDRAFT_207548 [Capitella teleta]|uniref:G-protein coupled receptors family 2 profile 1 domain-containing protein n=1 Tax=Capitella teleta TaxID=283909 RepID=R7V7K5_CAPTE|nr:hypothetical protein CAPTEDRAFT_207548 [Capitella teleta]|eukprot:ELU14838.1 hypothetical protein CAPTEDRAFT_207548 [Capitella teleta]
MDLCRSREGLFPPPVFNLHACADCYGYLYPSGKPLRSMLGVLVGQIRNVTEVIVPDIRNASRRMLVCSGLNSDECLRWTACCLSADVCCREQLTATRTKDGCPHTWDGFSCWSATPHDRLVEQPCPTLIPHALPTDVVLQVKYD